MFHLCFLFVFVGLVIAFTADLRAGNPVIYIADLVAMPAMVVFWLLGWTGKIPRNTGVGANMIISTALFLLSLIPSGFSVEYIELQFFYMMNLIITFMVLSGFLVHRWLPLFFGAVNVPYTIWIYFQAPTDFVANNLPTLIVVLTGTSILVYYYRKKLERLVNDLVRQKQATEAALEQLQIAQKQIVLQEKMASLGSLTAGIAHEIKNPLNFVNNFAESSLDLMRELREHFEQHKDAFNGDSAADVEYLIGELSQNMRDIAVHGKRGNSIVQNMLMHSRGGESVMYVTDLNELVKEAANLAYHGYRAREVDFRADLKYEFDEKVGQIPLVAHEMNRVFLNIVNNALYAGHKRVKSGGIDVARVKISTARVRASSLGKSGADWVEIRIRDNGEGISQTNIERIFMPFFTTKPTGEGTGLGLSISYEIVTVGHNGMLTVESKEGEYAEFVLRIPCEQAGDRVRVR